MKSPESEMKEPRQKGIALILVITAMAIIGLEMHVLSGGSNTMLHQSNRIYLQACKRNLTASGLAWAKQNIRNNNTDVFGKRMELDASALNIKDSGLTVTVSTAPDKAAQAQINASCSRSGRTLRSNKKYEIEL
jgi:hypothetical protein